MITKKIATIALGLAMAAPLGLASQASAATIVTAVGGCGCSDINTVGGFVVLTSKTATNTYDFTFSLVSPLGSGDQILSQMQASIKGSIAENIGFTLYSNIGTALNPIAGTNYGSSGTHLAATLQKNLPIGNYFLQVDPISVKGELISGAIEVFAVPEPASWALMLVGFGGLGFALRSRRKMAKAAA